MFRRRPLRRHHHAAASGRARAHQARAARLTNRPPRPLPKMQPDKLPASRPAAPQISPQISPGDQATFQRKTETTSTLPAQSQSDLVGKQLSAAQLDLVEKIKSFVGQSNEASKTGDWARAQNLSQKARCFPPSWSNLFSFFSHYRDRIWRVNSDRHHGRAF